MNTMTKRLTSIIRSLAITQFCWVSMFIGR